MRTDPNLIEQHCGTVRRISRDGDVVVQRLVDGQWQDYLRFNEMSDDYAYTNSRNAARRLVSDAIRAAYTPQAPVLPGVKV